MNQREIVAVSIVACVARLEAVLKPWGFAFEYDGCQSSHTGPYASGHFIRDLTRIGLSCRETIDNLYYQHSFVTEHMSWRENERFTIGHGTLMDAVGHAADCCLIEADGIPDAIVARDGTDRVDALIHDWSTFAAPILREPCAEFFSIVRRGRRSYTVA